MEDRNQTRVWVDHTHKILTGLMSIGLVWLIATTNSNDKSVGELVVLIEANQQAFQEYRNDVEKDRARMERHIENNTISIRDMEKYLPMINGSLNTIKVAVVNLQKDTKSLEKNQAKILPVVDKAHSYIIKHWKD